MSEPCRSCGAPVIWRRHAETHRWAPLDAVPVEAGGFVLVLGSTDYRAATPADARARVPAPRYVSHFATCPNAAKHRGQGVQGALL